jgi:3-methyl-2-oxobutanoate hydroxymethyltransferase
MRYIDKPMKKKLSVRSLLRKKEEGIRIVALTAYDAPTARFAERCGAELVLVGDSLGMTVLGYANTLPVTVADMLHHTRAVARGIEAALLVTDMPFLSYQTGWRDAIRNAGLFLKEGGADAVKIEGGGKLAPLIGRMVRAGIPVLGHIGILPQSVLTTGGYRVVGRTREEADRLLQDAKAVEEAGAFAIVLEGIPAELSRSVTEALRIPTIGIGAGVHCDGQIQVMNDLLGLFPDFVPKHARQYLNLGAIIPEALQRYADDVRDGRFPGPENSF